MAHKTKVQFGNCKRQKDEAMPEMVCYIERLMQQAYLHQCTSSMHETLAIDQLITTIKDEDMLLHIRQGQTGEDRGTCYFTGQA